jgi:hypothetical protein
VTLVGVNALRDLGVGAGRVRERPEDVEDGPRPEFRPGPDDRLHRRVEHGREHEAHVARLDAALDGRRFGVDGDAEFPEHVGAPGRGGHRVVAVFGDRDPGAADHERGSRRDVDRVVAVAAGAARIHEGRPVRVDRSGRRPHPPGEPRDLGLGLALRPEARQQPPDLCLGRLFEDRRRRRAGLRNREVPARGDALDVLLHPEHQ